VACRKTQGNRPHGGVLIFSSRLPVGARNRTHRASTVVGASCYPLPPCCGGGRGRRAGSRARLGIAVPRLPSVFRRCRCAPTDAKWRASTGGRQVRSLGTNEIGLPGSRRRRANARSVAATDIAEAFRRCERSAMHQAARQWGHAPTRPHALAFDDGVCRFCVENSTQLQQPATLKDSRSTRGLWITLRRRRSPA
jgi:hypothetical protein